MEKGGKDPREAEKTKRKGFEPSRIRSLCIIGIFLALMCVLSPISIPLEPVSITLATLMIYLLGAVFPWKISLPIVLLYLLLGIAGMPIFSNFQGGVQVLAGPTGGFLIGYLPCVLSESLLLRKWKEKRWIYPLAMLFGTVFLYAFGAGWFLIYGKGDYDFSKAMMLCVIPFLPGDALKIAVASFAGFRLRRFVDSEMGRPWEKG